MSNFWQAVIDGLYLFYQGVINALVETARFLDNLQKLHAWSIIAFFGLLWYGVTYGVDAVNWAAEQLLPLIADLVFGGSVVGVGQQQPSALETAFSILNAFLPLTELFGFVTFMLPVWMTAVTIRAVKSWVPTVN